MKQKITTIMLGILLMTGLVSAAFVFDDESSRIDDAFTVGGLFTGVVNMSFDEQENADFTSSVNGSISLINLLGEMGYEAGNQYTCDPVNCMSDYTASGGSEEVTFPIDGELLYGFKLTGSNVEASQLKFNITGTAGQSCINQLAFDFFNDGGNINYDYYNKNFIDVTCGAKNWGCFAENNLAGVAVIGTNAYCEKFNFPAAPSYRVGAVIETDLTEAGSGAPLTFTLYKPEGISLEFLEEDIVSDPVGDRPEIHTTIPYSSDVPFEGFICVTDEAGSNDYRIRIRQGAENVCGGTIGPSNNIDLESDYEIFMQPLKYDSIGTIVFDDSYYQDFHGENLIDDINDYISGTYGGDCTGSNGCVLPLSILGRTQDITINNVRIIYNAGNVLRDERRVFELSESEYTVSSDFINLDVEKMGFEVPELDDDEEEIDFTLYFDNIELLTENATVEAGFNFNIAPKFALVGQTTQFSIISGEEIESSAWDFGDDTAVVNSNNNKASHLYLDSGDYTVTVTAESALGDSEKTFTVTVGDAKISANLTLNSIRLKLENIESQLSSFPEWVRVELEDAIMLDEIKANFDLALNDYGLLGEDATEGEYVVIINRLLEIEVPLAVSITGTGSLPADVGYGNLNPSLIGEISGIDSITNAQEVRLDIIGWMDDNYNVDVDFDTISRTDDDGREDILTTYKITANMVDDASGDFAYLLIDYPLSSVKFSRNYNADSIQSGSAFSISMDGDSRETIEFLIVGETAPKVEDMGIYISPVLDDIGTSTKPFGEIFYREGKFRWGLFIIAMSVLLVVFLAVYLTLQAWYKRYYEKHLFKNPNDLYNLINFIYNSRRAGLEDKEIRAKLRDKKWKREQITYAFKKIDGKRTGMWEIPIFKFMENRKVKQELQKKQGGRPIDARFIKR